MVPAFDGVTPRTEASSAFDRPAKNFRATSSRSRGSKDEIPARRTERRQAPSTASVATGAGRLVGRLDRQRRQPPTPSQLVQGGVAGDPEQPRTRLASPSVERAALAVGALERRGGHVFRGGAVAQHPRDVGEHVVATRPIEGLEVQPGPDGLGGNRHGKSLVHSHTTALVRTHHKDLTASAGRSAYHPSERSGRGLSVPDPMPM